MIRASMLDVPNVHDSVVTSISSNITKHVESKENNSTTPKTMNERKSQGRKSEAKTKKRTDKALPPTELLSSLGLDESEAGNRTSVFSSYWDSHSPDLDDEPCESGAMALVRSIEGDVMREGVERRWCYCLLEKFDIKTVLLCVVLFATVVVLVMAVPYHTEHNTAMDASPNKNVPTLLPSDTDKVATNDNAAASTAGDSNTNSLSLAEEIIRVCNPKGYDHDAYKCHDLCYDKECCFVDPDNELVQYCGDELWHNCLTYAGCEPSFS
jgi:hypothetical protein